jgi:DNA-binding CsgD family transcriptional regulator
MAIQAVGLSKAPLTSTPSDTAAELIRHLVEQVLTGEGAELETAPPSPVAHSEEIILDIDVDDARYLLVRLPKTERSRGQLSPREQENVRMVAPGHSNKVIADVLSISTWTVCTHLRRIFAKLGVGSRAAMVARLMGNTSSARVR